MTQTIPKLVTFDEFMTWYPENSGIRYELHSGEIAEITPPAGEHEEIKGFLVTKLVVEYERLNLPYFIPNQAVVKPPKKESGYFPDVLILNRTNLANESRWKKESTITQGKSIPLIIEVVSTNWEYDYALKLDDYEEMGIPEYWIVDYLGLGGRKFIGNPKRPTISIYRLVGDEYQVTLFRGSDPIVSPTFPELNLTTEQIFQAGQ